MIRTLESITYQGGALYPEGRHTMETGAAGGMAHDTETLKGTRCKSCFKGFKTNIIHDRVSGISGNIPTNAFCPPICILFVCSESCFYTSWEQEKLFEIPIFLNLL